MKKRYSAVLLALALTFGILPAQAWAARPDPAAQTAALSDSDAPDRDALFAGYVQQTFYLAGQEAMLAHVGDTALSGADLQVYNRLTENIVKVANGSLATSEFNIDVSGLGVTYSGGSLQGIDTSKIISTLLVDLPYEMYWYDKTNGGQINYSYNSSRVVSSIRFQMAVSQDYAVTTPDGQRYYTYRPDPAKTGAASAAAQNARAVVDYYAGLSDYDKLTAYRDYISDQVSYNYDAAGASNYPYGDPWQMIYVFDGNPNTNVVCEGYSKAFKYLCDISTFSSDVDCYIVSGNTTGPHMWNIVRINGQNYLADITNYDIGSVNISSFDALFLAGAPNGTANGYTIHVPRYELGGGSYMPAYDISYTYGNDTKQLFSAGLLTLSASDCVPSTLTQTPSPAPSSGFTDLPDWCAVQAQWAADNGIAKGTGGGRFSPGATCTQAQILTFLHRAAGEPASTARAPVAVGADYANAVDWAYGEGMIDASFDPQAPCSRIEAVTYIWRALGSPRAQDSSSFTDLSGVAAVDWAVEQGVTDGFANGDGTFSFLPGNPCSRGQIVTLLYRAYT